MVIIRYKIKYQLKVSHTDMSFLSVQVVVPLWLLLLMIIGLIHLFFQLLKWLKGKGILNKADIVLDGHMKTIVPEKTEPETGRKPNRQNEVNILKLLALKGEQGILLQSIADALAIESNEANNALEYLEGKKLVEVIKGMSGNKFFLSQVGKNYCDMKGYSQVV